MEEARQVSFRADKRGQKTGWAAWGWSRGEPWGWASRCCQDTVNIPETLVQTRARAEQGRGEAQGCWARTAKSSDQAVDGPWCLEDHLGLHSRVTLEDSTREQQCPRQQVFAVDQPLKLKKKILFVCVIKKYVNNIYTFNHW